uniref:Uncharacterized protein n=1 Tax=Rhizophora mucronata TaxID=61149 RepID=A0A2P2PJN8_RHIMU
MANNLLMFKLYKVMEMGKNNLTKESSIIPLT